MSISEVIINVNGLIEWPDKPLTPTEEYHRKRVNIRLQTSLDMVQRIIQREMSEVVAKVLMPIEQTDFDQAVERILK